MKLTLICVGRMKTGPERALIDEYEPRIRAIGRGLGVTSFEIREMATINLPGRAKIVALDSRGRNLSSEELGATIAGWRDEGVAEIAFLIGGAEGLDPALAARADLKLAFGRATFPHLLVRAMLVEQIYRAMTILAGHPYHRA